MTLPRRQSATLTFLILSLSRSETELQAGYREVSRHGMAAFCFERWVQLAGKSGGGGESAPTPPSSFFFLNTFITFMKHSKCPPRPTLIPLGNNSSCLLSDEGERSARDVRGRGGRSLSSRTQVGSLGGCGQGCLPGRTLTPRRHSSLITSPRSTFRKKKKTANG